ncbi:MAG: SIMPL domain-containing protein [Myxococcales bacterium]|nr:SIMPL domain-containing protein [Myxococcales bacterium]MCB9705296.1 SIMPL domain-containing protein [Myxococcales bacterium]
MGSKDDDFGTLDVSGEGQVSVKPDRAVIRLAVICEAKSAQEAVDDNAKAATAVIEAIKALGIAESAIQTQGLSVSPIYQYDEARRVNEIVGYRADNAVAVDAAIDLAGKVYDAGIAAGANQSSGISFKIGDERPHRRRALEGAVEAARSDAEVVAAAMGVKVRGPLKIEVDAGGGPVIKVAEALTRASTPVMPGELTVSARVRVSFSYRF